MNSRTLLRWRCAVLSVTQVCVLLAARSTLAQGEVYFNNRVVGGVVTHVYLPSPANPGLIQVGNGTADYPPGTVDWTGWTPVSGAGFSGPDPANPYSYQSGNGPSDFPAGTVDWSAYPLLAGSKYTV